MIPIQQFHPILVHFPIVFILSLAAFDVIAVLRGAEVTGRSIAGRISVAIAILAGLSAAAAWIFGGVALDFAEAGGFSSGVAEIHESLGTVTAIAFVLWALLRAFAWWRDWQPGRGVQAVVALVEVAGALLVIATAYYGGQLVYDLGVNVTRAATGG
jgi:uncharacterized membrane protein